MIRNRLRRRWLILAIVGAVLLAIASYRPYLADWLYMKKQEVPAAASPFPVGERTLIIAPHPDDEALGGASVIQKAIAAGKQVKVLIMTSGDGYRRAVEQNLGTLSPTAADFRRLGEIRHLESLAAMKHFGVPAENVIFLGYPDGGVNGMWEADWDYDHLHKGLNGSDRSPYAFSYEKNAPYCGANVVKNLSEIFRDYKPTDVVYPDPNDQHHDHWATSAFVKYLLTLEHYSVREWTYLVHRGDFPTPWEYRPELPLNPPYVLTGLDTNWVYVPVSKKEERQKREALQFYKTQTKVMDPFLEAFVRTNGLLGTYKDPVLQSVSGEPAFDNSNQLPYTLFLDAHADTFRREAEPGADVMAVGAVRSTQTLHIGLETKAAISPQVMYNFRVRFFRPDGVKRLDITVHGSQISARKYAGNSLDLPPGATVQVKGNRLWITLPATTLDGASGMFLATDTFIGNERIDKTSWRLIKVQK